LYVINIIEWLEKFRGCSMLLKKLTSSYLICVISVISIIYSMLSSGFIDIFIDNILFFLTMFLTRMRAVILHDSKFDKNKFNFFALTITIYVIFSFIMYRQYFPKLENTFLIIITIIKLFYYGWGWLSTVSILLKRTKVTGQTIAGAITGYLFIAIIWSFLYRAFMILHPGSLHVEATRDYELNPMNLAMYFSLTTLTTLGFGDLVPVYKLMMVFSTFEAVIGVFYMTVVVARLVSLYETFE